jgi:hypothetical protein
LLRLTAACTYASPVEYEFRAEIKISRFCSFASISPIINGGGKGYTAKPKLYFSQKNLFQLKSDNSQIDTKSPNYVNI